MMSPRKLAVSAVIDADVDAVFSIIADYHHGHPAILPRPPFESLVVEEGGHGAGTTIRVVMRVLGMRRSFRAVVTEPEPGRILMETNDTGYVTTFLVAPDARDGRSRVTISTRGKEGHGIAGTLEWWLVRRLLRPVFARELELLAKVAGRAGGSHARDSGSASD